MSPVIGLLNNFIVSSPFRIMLTDSLMAGSPILPRPEKRQSLFARTDGICTPDRVQHRPRQSITVFKTPLQSATPVSVRRRRLTTRPVLRRRTVQGIWPSLIDKQTPDNKSTNHLQPSITPAELTAHTALRTDSVDPMDNGFNSQDDPAASVDFTHFPYVKKWKNEIDLSLHAS